MPKEARIGIFTILAISAAVALTVGLMASTAAAQDAGSATHSTKAGGLAAGKADFDQYCAQCHGANGKGNGPETDMVAGIAPPDLTHLAAGNGGKFPAELVAETIDGRKGIPSHRRFDMPFWGVNFQESGKEFTPASEAQAKARINALVAYIESIQAK